MKIKSLFTPTNGNSSLVKRAASLFFTGAAALLFQAVVVQPAFAHHIVVSATVACTNGAPVISYTATSWDVNSSSGPGAGENPAINVTFNGVTVDTEPFIDPLDSFSGTRPAPLNTVTVDVSANTTSLWGDGFDPAGDAPTNVVTLTIPTDCAPGEGRFTGGGKQVAVGVVTVTKGFEVDCDLHQPSNNLEINWSDAGGTHQFHMTAFTAAVCTKPGIPNPPPAPVNRIDGTGTGRFDNTYGYTVMFTLIDNGEPGKNDEAGFLVFETAHPANVVLNVPLAFITGGNVQAHVDQK